MKRLFFAVALALFALPAAAHAATPLVEGESSSLAKTSGLETQIVSCSSCSGTKALKVISNGSVTATVNLPSADTLVVRDRTDYAASAAVYVDGVQKLSGRAPGSYTVRSLGSYAAGSHTVKVTVGNTSASNYFLDYIGRSGSGSSDTTPPGLPTITGGPGWGTSPPSTSSTDGTFTWSAAADNVGVAGYECAFDSSTYSACSSGVSRSGFSVGTHHFGVRAYDAAGNRGNPAQWTWDVTGTPSDTTAPDTSITSGPADGSSTTSTSASFGFAGTDNVGVTGFDCSLDGGAFSSCTSPKAYSGLSAASHSFRVRARDAAGNVDASPAQRSWTVTAQPPSGETRLQAYVTGYSWFDNTPPGSAEIAYPQIHQQAGGVGTYQDPITVAVGHSLASGQSVPVWPAGTRFYIPNLRRYFVVEDACGDGPTPQNGPCYTGYPSPATTWLDVWVGGQNSTESASNACMNAITDVHLAIKDPASNYAVVPGDIAGSSCSQQFGDTVVTQ